MENNETYEAYYRVLVTEDEKPISRNICKKIEKINPKFKVTEVAYNGKQALEQIKRNTFDVLFLDINIPFFSGLDILKYITENHIHSYCVLLTGYQTFEYAQTALRYKALDYLLKPLDNAKLAEVLKKIEHLKEREKREASLSFLMNTPNRIFERENKSFKTCYVGCVLYNTLQGRLYLQKTTEQLKTSKATLNSLLAQEFKQNEYALIDGHDIVEQILLFSQDTTKLKERCHTIQKSMQKKGAICGLGINTQAKTIEQIKETYLQLRLNSPSVFPIKQAYLLPCPTLGLFLLSINQKNGVLKK